VRSEQTVMFLTAKRNPEILEPRCASHKAKDMFLGRKEVGSFNENNAF